MIELNKIYRSDCLDFINSLPDNYVDLVVTSPPYNIGIEYDSWNDRMFWKDYFEWCATWLTGIFRILKEDGKLCLNHYISFGSGNRGFQVGIKKGTEQSDTDTGYGIRIAPLCELNTICQNIGFNHHALVVWEDITLSRKTAWGSWLSASSPYINCPYEGILIMYKKHWKKLNKGESTITKSEFIKLTRGRWEIRTEMKGLTKANFPVGLPSKCINLLTYKDDLVFDPFMGSGTTAIAALKNKRKYIGCEISENYHGIAEKRVKDFLAQKTFI